MELRQGSQPVLVSFRCYDFLAPPGRGYVVVLVSFRCYGAKEPGSTTAGTCFSFFSLLLQGNFMWQNSRLSFSFFSLLRNLPIEL